MEETQGSTVTRGPTFTKLFAVLAWKDPCIYRRAVEPAIYHSLEYFKDAILKLQLIDSPSYYQTMKSVPFVLVLLVLLVSTEFAAVNGRPLRSSTATKDNVGIKRGGADDKAVAASVPTLAVSANNSKSGNSFRSPVNKLASGPSKKGPGH
ncbi:hypothetical protein HRI_005202400 [Hibiscus trionum]|uniref:Uncharacterized protein n=1 Tax=Hibiscus trionum TaxID=183268 RepID=A0A9W7JL06_HIBTR|nr:hypothetical protein HRI_005202400 [Hibiscus trionum]